MGVGDSINDLRCLKLFPKAVLSSGRKLPVLPVQIAENALIQTDCWSLLTPDSAGCGTDWVAPALALFMQNTVIGWVSWHHKRELTSCSPSKTKGSTKVFQLNWKSWGWRPWWGSTGCSVNLGAYCVSCLWCTNSWSMPAEVFLILYGPWSLWHCLSWKAFRLASAYSQVILCLNRCLRSH